MSQTTSIEEQYWTKENIRALEDSQSFVDIVNITVDILQRMPKPIGWVCGPLANGGVGSLEGNLKEFDRAILRLRQEGKNIFSQLPMEARLMRIGRYDESHNKGPKTALLEGYYLPVFESKLISTLGATWEHAQA